MADLSAACRSVIVGIAITEVSISCRSAHKICKQREGRWAAAALYAS